MNIREVINPGGGNAIAFLNMVADSPVAVVDKYNTVRGETGRVVASGDKSIAGVVNVRAAKGGFARTPMAQRIEVALGVYVVFSFRYGMGVANGANASRLVINA